MYKPSRNPSKFWRLRHCQHWAQKQSFENLQSFTNIAEMVTSLENFAIISIERKTDLLRTYNNIETKKKL